MKVIHKFPLQSINHNAVKEIDMPKGAKIISCQMQGNEACIWALVNPKNSMRKRTFHVFGTGFDLIDYDKKHYEFIATIQQKTSVMPLVWHVFEVHE